MTASAHRRTEAVLSSAHLDEQIPESVMPDKRAQCPLEIARAEGVIGDFCRRMRAEHFQTVAVCPLGNNEEKQMRNDIDRREGGISTAAMAAIGALVLFGLLFMWAPWDNSRVADNTAPGTTTGSTTRPAAPASPAAPSPAAPSPTR
jgi:hypothetical protein